jgi:hypothetical protein
MKRPNDRTCDANGERASTTPAYRPAVGALHRIPSLALHVAALPPCRRAAPYPQPPPCTIPLNSNRCQGLAWPCHPYLPSGTSTASRREPFAVERFLRFAPESPSPARTRRARLHPPGPLAARWRACWRAAPGAPAPGPRQRSSRPSSGCATRHAGAGRRDFVMRAYKQCAIEPCARPSLMTTMRVCNQCATSTMPATRRHASASSSPPRGPPASASSAAPSPAPLAPAAAAASPSARASCRRISECPTSTGQS